jgi:hypothetical protein
MMARAARREVVRPQGHRSLLAGGQDRAQTGGSRARKWSLLKGLIFAAWVPPSRGPGRTESRKPDRQGNGCRSSSDITCPSGSHSASMARRFRSSTAPGSPASHGTQPTPALIMANQPNSLHSRAPGHSPFQDRRLARWSPEHGHVMSCLPQLGHCSMSQPDTWSKLGATPQSGHLSFEEVIADSFS